MTKLYEKIIKWFDTPLDDTILEKRMSKLSVSLRINQSYIFKSYIFSMLCCHFVPPNFRNTIYHNIVDI
jgi:hypothetical protein